MTFLLGGKDYALAVGQPTGPAVIELVMGDLLRIPGAKGTAGSAATTKKTMKSPPGYMWNVNHTVPIDDPMELFPVHMTEAGV